MLSIAYSPHAVRFLEKLDKISLVRIMKKIVSIGSRQNETRYINYKDNALQDLVIFYGETGRFEEAKAEPTLEPDIPICDPHHHFWEYCPEPLAYQRYLLQDLADDINSGHNARSTVFIEARSSYRTSGPEEMRSVGEVEFVEALAAASESGQYGPGRAAAASLAGPT